MDLQSRWRFALRIAVPIAIAATTAAGAALMISPWVGVGLGVLGLAIVLVLGKWPQIRARYPKVQKGVTWTKEPRPDGVLITLQSEHAGQDGFFLAYFGGPAAIESATLEAPASPGQIFRQRMEYPRARATKNEIVVIRSTVPSNTVRLKLITAEEIHVTEVRHLRAGDLTRLNRKPLQGDPPSPTASG